MPEASRAARAASGVRGDWFLVSALDDVRWLTGFSGGTATALLSGTGEVHLFVDGRYHERAVAELAESGNDATVHRVQGGAALLDSVSAVVGAGVLGLDPERVTLALHDSCAARMKVERCPSPLRGPRRVKDPTELALIEWSARIADAALQQVVSEGIAGESERSVRRRLDDAMASLGADDVSFPTIVASGPNAARPHHEPGERFIGEGDVVIIDMGAAVGGYRSDMTRTLTVGSVPAEAGEMWEVVREAQQAGLDTVRAGVEGRAVDAAVRAVFSRNGVEHEYLHGTGHGVGLLIHEQPILGPSCTETLLEGEVVTVEPGLYRGGTGGVRIEDLVVVTATGCRILTQTPKELPCPPSPRTT